MVSVESDLLVEECKHADPYECHLHCVLLVCWSEGPIPDTWFTDYSGDMLDTFSGTKEFGAGSTRPFSRSKKSRSKSRISRFNGKVERSHPTDKDEFCQLLPIETMSIWRKS